LLTYSRTMIIPGIHGAMILNVNEAE